MTRMLCLAVCSAVLAAPPLEAQRALPHSDILLFGGPTYWNTNIGSGGGHVGAEWRPRNLGPLSFGVLGFYGPARADSITPAIISLQAGMAVSFSTNPGPHLSLSLSVAPTHFDARRQQALVDQRALRDAHGANYCGLTPFCSYQPGGNREVVLYHTGWAWMWGPALNLEFPLRSGLSLRSSVQRLMSFSRGTRRVADYFPGSVNPGPHPFNRMEVGLQWRP